MDIAVIAFFVALTANWRMSEISSRYLTDEQKLALYHASPTWPKYVVVALLIASFTASYAHWIPESYLLWSAWTPLVVWLHYGLVRSHGALRASGTAPAYMRWFYGRAAIFSAGLLALYAAVWRERIG